jgi:biopolymer transport protein ExbD
MSMKVDSAEAADEYEVMIDINTTPLIDVLLVMLIMLIITIPIQTHAVKLDMPDVNAPSQSETPPVVTVEVDFDGTVIWEGTMVTTRADLGELMRNVALSSADTELHIRPNRLAEYEHVAKVLAVAQRAGVTKIGVVGNEQYMPRGRKR